MSDDGRKCTVKSDFGDYEARFIKFGQIMFRTDSGDVIALESAFVEKEDGQVCSVNPQTIKFTK